MSSQHLAPPKDGREALARLKEVSCGAFAAHEISADKSRLLLLVNRLSAVEQESAFRPNFLKRVG